ncbi:MAG TPA: galactose-1-phosphate uridylyltransferase [Thermodesulfobacteriota bacterium]|nr:galactose-1-phosphate uridylyltransferase [Thermodesulfobacteriota bacterium]
MSELRKDPVTGRWVIISTERGKRPSDFGIQKNKSREGFCPFDPGNEDKTPPEIMAFRQEGTPRNGPGWRLRVVPNKFPALRVEGEINREGVGLYDKVSGIGAHEVIIETPNHQDTLTTLAPKQFEEVLWAYRHRMLDLRKDTRLRYAMIFKNHGEAAGATLEHSHSQLIALPIVPHLVMEEMTGARDYYSYKERCIFCDIVRQEIQQGERVVLENAEFIVVAPFASFSPFEAWILPKRHGSFFEESQVYEIQSLSWIFQETLKRLEKALNFPPYNFTLHTTPFKERSLEYYHWHFEIIPKLTKFAGFEWGSGFFINPTPPEEAAKFLRELNP